MRKLSKRQSEAIRAMANGAPVTPLKIGCRIDTMKSLVKRGLVRQIEQSYYKRFWSYNINFRFTLIPVIFEIEGLHPLPA